MDNSKASYHAYTQVEDDIKENITYLNVDLFTRSDRAGRLQEKYRTASNPTGSNIGMISTHLLRYKNEAIIQNLEEPLKEINDTIAHIGYPECGYVIYKVNSDFKSDYDFIMEGWWLSREVYDQIHDCDAYKAVFEKHKKLFTDLVKGQTYFRMNKFIPVL